MPTFHQLWNDCMEKQLTSSTDDMVELLEKYDVSDSSAVLDTCVGGGTSGVQLLSRGFSLTTADGSAEMLTSFREKLHARGMRHEPVLAQWRDFPRVFRGRHFDALICCGNSLIYAGGHWNHEGEIDREWALDGVREALTIFRRMLSSGGILLVDKPSDNEQATEEQVAELLIGSDAYDAFFSVRFDGDRRTAQILLRHQVTGEELGTPNVAYRLTNAELEGLFVAAGFSSFERVARGVNDHFPLWIAKT